MSYLKFDKTVMINLEESLTREVLRTNRLGAYHSSTVVDCNTRKYHGLLVMPVPALDDDNHVLLSSLDETVIQHGAEFNLGLHKYGENNFSPKGHKYIREYTCDTVPRTVYRVGGVIFSKEKVFSMYENRIMIKYTLEDAHSETTLRFRPFLAFRSVKELTYANGNLNQNYTLVPNGVKMCLYAGYPELFMQFSKKVNFVFDPKWYYGIEYSKEQERGYPYKEDLFVPGYFEVPVKKGETIIFSAGDSQVATTRLKSLYAAEIASRTPRTSFYNCLKNSAQQFYFRPKEQDAYLLAGYPWFKCRARDMLISLPGLTLVNDEVEQYEMCMKTVEKGLREFMAGEPLTVKIYEIEHPDILLWAMWCIQQYAKIVSWEKCVEKYGPLAKAIMEFISSSSHPNLKVRENGLLYAKGKDKAVTWMNSTANGRPIVPRSGYIVEFNALWYNALKFSEEICGQAGLEEERAKYAGMAEQVGVSFKDVFLNPYGYLFDYVDENDDHPDWSVRPNMIFAVALDFSPLTLPERKAIFDLCTKELLTPKGLRTLSPKSGGYNPMYVGPQVQRDYAYHQGTAWPWLSGFYMEACLKLYKNSRVSFVERVLVGFEEEMFYHCLGTLPELFDGNPPFHGRGAISFAMNVAEILRVVKLVEKYIS